MAGWDEGGWVGGMDRPGWARVGAMVNRDGNGWTTCGQGHRHWGRFGAAGLLAFAPDEGQTCVLLQRRSWWGNYGGAWGPPGGARDSHESAVAAALREAEEECAMPPGAVGVTGIFRDDHGGWSYQTVIASAPRPFPVRAVSSETSQASWVAAEDVEAFDLHPGFAEQWPVLRMALQPLAFVVDVANVMGSRPDGWWRDRAGAARRLRDQLAVLAASGVPALPETMRAPPLERWFPDFVLVVEGAARSIAAAHAEGSRGSERGGPSRGASPPGSPTPPGPPGMPGGAGRVRVVAAPGSGDDTIAELARDLPGRRLVVTADRELRDRCTAAGASVTGPGWLLGQL
jgi:8-oxo-dGTP diphosphatase